MTSCAIPQFVSEVRRFAERFCGAPEVRHRHDGDHGLAVARDDGLFFLFRPVLSAECGVDALGEVLPGAVDAHGGSLGHVETVQQLGRTFVHDVDIRTDICTDVRWEFRTDCGTVATSASPLPPEATTMTSTKGANIPAALRHVRDAGWSTVQLASDLGVTLRTVQRWAAGLQKPNKVNFAALRDGVEDASRSLAAADFPTPLQRRQHRQLGQARECLLIDQERRSRQEL